VEEPPVIGAAVASKAARSWSRGHRRIQSSKTPPYSPCGIPFPWQGDHPTSSRCSWPAKEAYGRAGIDIHYQPASLVIDVAGHKVDVEGQGKVDWDSLVVATGFDYADPGVPGTDLQGPLYYVKNIRQAMEWERSSTTPRRRWS